MTSGQIVQKLVLLDVEETGTLHLAMSLFALKKCKIKILQILKKYDEIQSKVGEGSTFTVELPLRIPHEEHDDSFWEDTHVKRILIADEDPDVIEGICAMMEGSGVQIETAKNGKEAVEMVKKSLSCLRTMGAL